MTNFLKKSQKCLSATIVAAGILMSAPALAIIDIPAYDIYHAEADLAQVGKNLTPNSCPSLPRKGEKLDIMQTINIALCNNISTRASWFQLKSQAINLNSTKVGQYLPNVQASGTFGRNYTRTDGSTTDSTSSGLSASLSYNLFDFGVREATITSAEKSIQAAMLSYDSSLQGLIASTINAYYNLLASDYVLSAARENFKFSEQSLKAAQVRYDIGLVAKSDILQTQSSYSQAKLSVQQAENNQQLAKNALLVLMGYTPDNDITVKDIDDSILAEDQLDASVQSLVEQAKLNRKDLAAQKRSLESSYASLDATKRSNLPSVSISAGQNYGGRDFFKDTTNTGTLGFSVSVPIFSGLTRAYTIKSAEEQIKSQELSLEQTKLDIYNDVWNAYINYKTAEESWMISFEALSSAAEFRDIALGRYKEGVGSLLDVLSGQSSYAGALSSHISTRFALLNARVNLVRSIGVLDLSNANPNKSISELKQ